jgi:hypothetical protein
MCWLSSRAVHFIDASLKRSSVGFISQRMGGRTLGTARTPPLAPWAREMFELSEVDRLFFFRHSGEVIYGPPLTRNK